MENPEIIFRIITDEPFYAGKFSSFFNTALILLNRVLKIRASVDLIDNGFIFYLLELEHIFKISDYANKAYLSQVKELKSKSKYNGSNIDEVSQLWYVYLEVNKTEFTKKEVLKKLSDHLNPESYFEISLQRSKTNKDPVLKLRTMPIDIFFKLVVNEYKNKFSLSKSS
ncbi:MAG: hypothetical protein GY870_20800 [archaeon]|nr:hypothetical protein [archaeon]